MIGDDLIHDFNSFGSTCVIINENFDEYLLRYNLKIFIIDKDNQCLLNSIRRGLETHNISVDLETMVENIRKIAIDNYKEYFQALDSSEMLNHGDADEAQLRFLLEQINSYLIQKQWCSQASEIVLNLLIKFFDLKLFIFRWYSDSKFTVCAIQMEERSSNVSPKQIFLRLKENHYDAIIPYLANSNSSKSSISITKIK